jgi:hypothetical protein
MTPNVQSKSYYKNILNVQEWKINIQIKNFLLNSFLKIQDSHQFDMTLLNFNMKHI